jgi:hypothetical protein
MSRRTQRRSFTNGYMSRSFRIITGPPTRYIYFLKKRYSPPKFAPLWVTILCVLVVSTIPSRGVYRGTEDALLFLLLFTITISTTDCSFSNVCPSCQRHRPPAWKNTHVTISFEQTNTCTQLPTALKQENSNLTWKRGVPDFYPCSTWQVQVRRALRYIF